MNLWIYPVQVEYNRKVATRAFTKLAPLMVIDKAKGINNLTQYTGIDL